MAYESTVTVEWESLVAEAEQGNPPPFPIYEFGGGRKKFLDIYNPSPLYNKPGDGSPDPDLQ